MATNPLMFHLSQLEKAPLVLTGEVTPAQADLEFADELVHIQHPLHYNLTIERLGDGVLVQGALRLVVNCECSRCLKGFEAPIEIKPWACHVDLEGDEQPEMKGDAVDLTPYIREDIVLALPQRPLCDSKCNGLPGIVKSDVGKQTAVPPSGDKPKTVWDQLDQLKLS